MRKDRRFGRDLLLGLLALALFGFVVGYQKVHYELWVVPSGKYVQKVRLPNVKAIEVAALGYDNLYADFLTLRAIQMFGAAWDTETGETRPIFDYFDILTSLDPHFIEVYELGHLVLSDEHRDHESALELIGKGISYNPGEARLPYLGIYTSLWEMNDPQRARVYLERMKHNVPDAPEHILRMEEYIERQSGRYHAAYDVNLGQFLRYTKYGMETEQSLAWGKFRAILDEWNRLELARAADSFRQKHGRHPKSIEEILADEDTVPRFEAPTLQALAREIDQSFQDVADIETARDRIRDASMTEIVGLPPDPYGTWYYIETQLLQHVENNPDAYPPEMPFRERYPYFMSMAQGYEQLNSRAMDRQQTLLDKMRQDGTAPPHEEIADLLVYDNYGGHWVYFEDPMRVFSTTTMRQIQQRDPRTGLSGTLENFPRRPMRVADGQTPYLQTEPSIWDFPEDIEWALCKGLEPGVPFDQQPQDLQDQANSRGVEYLHCDDHISPPDDE